MSRSILVKKLYFKKMGFTLIELLAVILILGVIALIAIPVISNIVKNAKKSAAITSARNLIQAAEQYYQQKNISDSFVNSANFICDGRSCKFGTDSLDIKGKLPEAGKVSVNSDGDVIVSILNYDFCITKQFRSDDIEAYDCSKNIKIESIEDLVVLANQVDSGDVKTKKTYVLIKDLDFDNNASYDDPSSTSYGDINGDGIVASIKDELTTSRGWNPIGTEYYTSRFDGYFNGLGNTINNLYINRPSGVNQGLFAFLTGKVVFLNLQGELYADRYSGLLTGLAYTSMIQNCNIKGQVIGSSNSLKIGMMAGSSSDVKISSSYVEGTVSGNESVGGLVGASSNNTVISDSNSNVSITGNVYIGGLVGEFYGSNSKIYNCFSKGNIDNASSTVGGLVALSGGIIKNSYSTMDITISAASDGNVGGLVGLIGCTDCDHSSTLVQNCYSTGDVIVNGYREGGSLIGQNGASSENNRTKYLTLRNSYSIGNINGNDKIGLIGIGVMNGENLFNGGIVTAYSNSGNIVGIIEGAGASYTNTYSFPEVGSLTNKTGVIVNKETVIISNWWKNTLSLDNSWKYMDGYYPLLYELDNDGNPTSFLLKGQEKIKIG